MTWIALIEEEGEEEEEGKNGGREKEESSGAGACRDTYTGGTLSGMITLARCRWCHQRGRASSPDECTQGGVVCAWLHICVRIHARTHDSKVAW